MFLKSMAVHIYHLVKFTFWSAEDSFLAKLNMDRFFGLSMGPKLLDMYFKFTPASDTYKAVKAKELSFFFQLFICKGGASAWLAVCFSQ